MKKVLYFASTSRHIMDFHLPYIRYFQQNGWVVHAACKDMVADNAVSASYDLPLEKRLISIGNLKVILRIARIIKKEEYQLISVHTTLAAAVCRLALLFSGCRDTKLMYTCHGYFFSAKENGKLAITPKALLYFCIEKMLASHTHALLTMNHTDDELARRYNLCKKIFSTHGMGYDATKPTHGCPRGGRVRRFGLPHNAVVFLCVGEFSRRKNQRELLGAFAEAARRYSGAYLVFAGDGALFDACRALARKLNLAERVRFLGYVTDMGDIYGIADVLVSASTSEGLPMSIMEGLHHRLPVIASRIKGHTDLIAHGVNGLLYAAHNEKQLADALLTMCDKAARDALKENANLPEKYQLPYVLGEWQAILSRIAEREHIDEDTARTLY